MPEFAQHDTVQPLGELEGDCTPDHTLEQKWFAVYTSPRHEKSVSHYMDLREIEHYLPLYQTRRKWNNGLKVTLDLPLFPGYIFVHIGLRERVRVLQVPGVLSIVGGTGGQPASMPEADINALRTGLPLRNAEPHPLLTAGQRVRIRSGALAGMEGLMLRRKNSLRVVLTMELIQRSVAVEVDETELEILDSKSSRGGRESASMPGPSQAGEFRGSSYSRNLS
jgi:transcription antitermination factor NusG